MRVEKDFEEFIELLNKHEVKYLVVGAYAVGFHAEPRYTGDIDFFVEDTLENAKKIVKVFKDFGFKRPGLTEKDLVKSGTIIQLGYPPNRIDIIKSISGVTFEKAYRRRVKGRFGDQFAFFISFNNLLLNKISSGRKKDKADVELLLKYKKMNKKKRN